MSICYHNCGSVYEGNGVTCELCQETNCGGPDCNIPNWRNSGWDVCTACQNDPDKCITYLLNETTALQNDIKKLRGMTKPDIPSPVDAFFHRFANDLKSEAVPHWADIFRIDGDLNEDDTRAELTKVFSRIFAEKK